MAKTSYISIPAGSEDLFFKGLNSNDRFMFSRIVRKDTLLSVKRKKGVSQRSLLPAISEIWAGFSDEQKAAWTAAASKMGLKGWQLFVQDQCIRIKNGMPGTATPSLLHQSWVGQIHIEAPAQEIKIAQYHPNQYWISKKVYGKKGMYEPVLIKESFGPPLKIGLNYSSNLSVVSSPNFAKFYAEIGYSYQGRNLLTYLEIPLDYQSDWKSAEATISSIPGIFIYYILVIHIFGLRGDLFFDNIKAEHSGQNWARDPYCRDVNQTFTRAFYQIPKHWAPVILPEGAEYDSVYKDF